MTPYYSDDTVTLHHGDCLDVLATLPDASIETVVTDPPYGLANTDPAHVAETITRWVNGERDYLPGGSGFMGKAWDAFVPPVAVWDECLRVLKPGGHVLTFAGSRTVDLMTLGLRLAGFDIRDSIAWLYGSGFPKSLDVSKAIDKAAGAEREVVGPMAFAARRTNANKGMYGEALGNPSGMETAPATPAAEQWQGWGTALKPSHEPVICARKPFNTVPLGEEVDRLHHLIGGLLWLSLSPAKRAELTSQSSPAGQPAGTCVSALVSAALDTSPDASDQTATFSSPALASTSSSIASSWSATLDALSARTRTSTTSTASSTTTALRTLSSLLGPITSQTTMPRCGCLVDGPSSPAPSAASSSSDEWAKWLHTLSASVPATATEGIALAVASALASIADELSGDQAAASSADPTATTGAAARDSAFEPIVVARKPLAGTVAQTVLQHGTGALNIDGCRVGMSDEERAVVDKRSGAGSPGDGWGNIGQFEEGRRFTSSPAGRWPTNVVLDDTQAAVLDEMSGESRDGVAVKRNRPEGGRAAYDASSYMITDRSRDDHGYGGQGGASRFFPTFRYEAKAPASERPKVNGTAHPTVKPLDLLRWLVRLVTPPGGTVLEPFAGSGTTVEACIVEGFKCVAIEKTDEYLPLTVARIHRRRDPVAAIKLAGDDLGLFDLEDTP